MNLLMDEELRDSVRWWKQEVDRAAVGEVFPPSPFVEENPEYRDRMKTPRRRHSLGEVVGRWCYFKDPEGNVFELKEEVEP